MNENIVVTEENGKTFFRGSVRVGNGEYLLIDTKTGAGVDKLCKMMQKFIYYQAQKTSFPSYSREDVVQELYALALEAVPKYVSTKNANILTFLQNHVQNRVINLCKFHSEKRRTASFNSSNTFKLRCNNCRNFFTKDLSKNDCVIKCPICASKGDMLSGKWKKYNIPIVPIAFTDVTAHIEEEDLGVSLADLVSSECDNASFMVTANMPTEHGIEMGIEIKQAIKDLDVTNKQIFSLISQGYSYKEIAGSIGITHKEVNNRIAKITKHLRKSLEADSAKNQEIPEA